MKTNDPLTARKTGDRGLYQTGTVVGFVSPKNAIIIQPSPVWSPFPLELEETRVLLAMQVIYPSHPSGDQIDKNLPPFRVGPEHCRGMSTTLSTPEHRSRRTQTISHVRLRGYSRSCTPDPKIPTPPEISMKGPTRAALHVLSTTVDPLLSRTGPRTFELRP